MASFNSTRVLLTLIGFCLFVHGVQSGIKSPYRKTDNLASGEKGLDNSGEERLQQKQELDELRTNITQLTHSFEAFKHVMEHHIDQIHRTVDTQCSQHSHNVHGQDSHSAVSDSHTRGPHGHGSSGECGRTRKYPTSFMRPPRIRNTDDFDIAVCDVKPNSKLQPSSNVTGRILLMQKKNSPTLYLSIRVKGFDISEHGQDGHDSLVERNQQELDRIQDVGQQRQDFSQQLSKMSQNQKIVDNGHYHAIQVHESADFSDGCDSTGGHFNPYNARHGSPESNIRHVGDFGNIDCDDEGVANLIITDENASLRGQYSIVGKSIVIHQGQDDFTTASASSASSGRGGRLACCVIEKIPSSLYNDYNFRGSKTQDGSSADIRQGQHGSGSHRGGGGAHHDHSHGQSGQSGSHVHPGGHDSAADRLGGEEQQYVPRPSRTGKNPYSG